MLFGIYFVILVTFELSYLIPLNFNDLRFGQVGSLSLLSLDKSFKLFVNEILVALFLFYLLL